MPSRRGRLDLGRGVECPGVGLAVHVLAIQDPRFDQLGLDDLGCPDHEAAAMPSALDGQAARAETEDMADFASNPAVGRAVCLAVGQLGLRHRRIICLVYDNRRLSGCLCLGILMTSNNAHIIS